MKKGDIATVVSVMTPEVIYAFYAADMIGASLNLVDPRYSAEGIHDYITEVDSHLLICLNVVYDRCQQAAKRTNVERVLVVSPADSLPLVLGLTVIIIPNLDPEKLGALIWKYKPEHMFGVPAHYQQMASSLLLKNKDLSFIRNYAAGGDAITVGAEQSVNDFLAAHGVEYGLAKGYGMTEVSSAATAASGLANKVGSVGIPLVNTLVSVFEPGTDTELPIGERGELCISGPAIMKGYYGKPAETAALLRHHSDGRVWAHTGDVGYMDEDGFVFLDSRIKRLIIRHDGFKVFPSMIENVISRHPAVQQCSVVGCTDKDHVQGRLPFVYVVLDPAADHKKRQIVRELQQICKEELPEYVQPVGYKFLDELPLTPIGKVDYRKLEEKITSRDY